MEFFNSAVNTLQTIVIGLGGGLCVWGGVNLLEGYGQDNPGAKSQGVRCFCASACSRPAASVNPCSRRIKNQLHTGGNHLFQRTTSFTPIRRGGMSAKTNRVQRKITIPP